MKTRFRRFFTKEWFLLLCPAFVAVSGFAHFSESIYWAEALVLFLKISFWSLALTLGFCFFLSFRKAALFVTVLVLANAVFAGFFEAFMMGQHPPFYARFRFLIPALVIVFGVLFYLLKKSSRNFGRLVNYLNFLFLLLLLFDVFQVSLNRRSREKSLIPTSVCDYCPRPDVYLLVTDGYAGQRQLREKFKYDNTTFLDSLRSLGFYIVADARSNYSATNVSMGSLLNMRYDSNPPDDVHAAFNANSVVHFFKQQGYKIVNNSFFKIDDQFPPQPIGYFETNTTLITQHTLVSQLGVLLQNYLYTKGVKFVLDMLEKHMKEETTENLIRDSVTTNRLLTETKNPDTAPRFIYSHFLMPHPPFLFDRNGRLFDKKLPAQSQYISYLEWTNSCLLNAAKAIIRNAKTPPIVLLISDHGYRYDDLPVTDSLRFYNLVSVYLPNKDYAPFYSGLSNVNLFRILLNHQYAQKLPLLPDSTVY